MISYRSGDDVGPLEFWPFDNPASQYRIVDGAPKAYGRLDAGGPGHVTRMGIWRCADGQFECIEQGDELMTILTGRGRLINHTEGHDTPLVPGDSLFVKDGCHVTWIVEETITKVFHGFKPGGY